MASVGRPKKEGNWLRYNVTLPAQLVERLDRQAAQEGRTRSDLLADGAEGYLRRAVRKPPRKPR